MAESVRSNAVDEVNRLIAESIVHLEMAIARLEDIHSSISNHAAAIDAAVVEESAIDAAVVEEAAIDATVVEEAANLRAESQRLSRLISAPSDTVDRAWLVIAEAHWATTPPPGDEAGGGGDGVGTQFETRHYDVEEGGETEDCCVCLERLRRGLVATLHCRHEFHGSCIGRWLLRGQNSCPLCKVRVIN
ncbi:ubiquitin-protein transferase activity protein [Salvia divinorum]|uniref:Ubiquitin-protein transferase activity protein n=1 Tax=Salvia divinorum TaxID=28513 RepID=A0ABD1IBU9_SALDI